MTDQHAYGGEGPGTPSPAEAPGEHAATPDRAGPGAARAPLGEWRGPAFWMACGALLAALAAGGMVLAHRVGVERDMMAVAATLPPAQPPAAVPAGAQPATVPGPAAAAAPSRALEPRPGATPAARRLAAREASAASAKPVRRPAAHKPSAMLAKTRAKAAAARRHRAAVEERYAGVFKRCPPRGVPGAFQCRRDICNGAEGKGPACKPYVRKLP